MTRPLYPVQHILLADDDLDHAFLFRRVLEQVAPELNLSVVHDGEELGEFLYFNSPDLLFLDLNMPCKTGFICLEELRRDPRYKKLPVVVYTSSSRQSDIRKAYSSQADLYLVKPFSTEHLKNALRSVLGMEWKGQDQKLYFINNKFVPVTA